MSGISRHALGELKAEGLYRLVDGAYENRSIALNSNVHPAAFDELMPLDTRVYDRQPAPSPRTRLPDHR